MKNLVFSLSVDDGHPLDLRLADLLIRHGIRASFYLPVRNIEGAPVMSPYEARTLAADFDIGAHTLEHRYLASLSEADAWHQIRAGKDALEQQIGRAVSGFCYPGGKYRRAQVSLVRRAGFRYARTVRNLYPHAGSCPLEMPTSLQFYPHGRDVLIRNFITQRDYATRWPALRAMLPEDDWLMRLYRLLDHLEQRGGVFHLWCHTIDIDRLQLWKALDHFLRFVARRITPAGRLDNAALVGHRSLHMAPVFPDHQKIM